MPITVGIPGGGTPGYVTTRQPAFDAMSVQRSNLSEAVSEIDVGDVNSYHGLEAIEVGATARPQRLAFSSEYIIYRTQEVSSQTGTVISGDSFLILADVLEANLAGSNIGQYGQYEIDAVYKINGTEVEIKYFSYQVPTGKLGSLLNVTLADGQNVSQVPNGATITLDLTVKVGGVTSLYNLVTYAKLQERNIKIAFKGGNNAGPVDEITVGALDIIADKFSLGPRRPVTMFDPSRVKYDSVNTTSENLMRDSHFGIIYPVIEAVYGLTMKQILNRAYTGIGGHVFASALPSSFGPGWTSYRSSAANDQLGCGFTQVITNIDDYPVRMANFTIEGGWHDGAQPSVAMYAPLYFVQGTKLFIWYTDKLPPASMPAHQLLLDAHKSLNRQMAFKPDRNAVALTYQYAKGDPFEDSERLSRDVRLPDDVVPTGTEGTAGYSVVTTVRWVREYYMADAPDDVLDSVPLSTDITTEQVITWYGTDGTPTGDSFMRTTGTEHIDYFYEGELNTGYERVIEASVANPASAFAVSLVTASRETCEIAWTDDPNNPGLKIQAWCTIEESGKCFFDPDKTETVSDAGGDVTFVRMIPILLAQASGIVESSWLMSGEIPIKTTKMTLHPKGGKQYDVEVIESDLLNNTTKKSYVDPTTGGHPNNDPYQSRSRTILLRDLTSEAEIGPRIPVEVNTYELPRDRAIALGNQVLQRFKNPLELMPIDLPGVDFAIAQGTIIEGQIRSDGFTDKHIVTGYSITGQNLGKQGHRISQSLETLELLAS